MSMKPKYEMINAKYKAMKNDVKQTYTVNSPLADEVYTRNID